MCADVCFKQESLLRIQKKRRYYRTCFVDAFNCGHNTLTTHIPAKSLCLRSSNSTSMYEEQWKKHSHTHTHTHNGNIKRLRFQWGKRVLNYIMLISSFASSDSAIGCLAIISNAGHSSDWHKRTYARHWKIAKTKYYRGHHLVQMTRAHECPRERGRYRQTVRRKMVSTLICVKCISQTLSSILFRIGFVEIGIWGTITNAKWRTDEVQPIFIKSRAEKREQNKRKMKQITINEWSASKRPN